jgi:hypothetical protein
MPGPLAPTRVAVAPPATSLFVRSAQAIAVIVIESSPASEAPLDRRQLVGFDVASDGTSPREAVGFNRRSQLDCPQYAALQTARRHSDSGPIQAYATLCGRPVSALTACKAVMVLRSRSLLIDLEAPPSAISKQSVV